MKMTPEQTDVLKEMINIGVGRAAGVLNEMVRFQVFLQVPFVKILSLSDLREEMETVGRYRVAAVRLGFRGPFFGTAALVFPPDSASKLVSLLTGEEPGTSDLDSVRAGTLTEVGNIVINGVMGSIGNLLKQRILYSLPDYMEDTIDKLLATNDSGQDPTVLLVRTRFTVQQLHIEGDILLLFEVGSFDALLSAINAVCSVPGEQA
jgi:chemotaxis protein CheC